MHIFYCLTLINGDKSVGYFCILLLICCIAMTAIIHLIVKEFAKTLPYENEGSLNADSISLHWSPYAGIGVSWVQDSRVRKGQQGQKQSNIMTIFAQRRSVWFQNITCCLILYSEPMLFRLFCFGCRIRVGQLDALTRHLTYFVLDPLTELWTL